MTQPLTGGEQQEAAEGATPRREAQDGDDLRGPARRLPSEVSARDPERVINTKYESVIPNSVQVSRARSLQHLNIGGTFITDESLYAVANSCANLKSIILWSCRHVTEAGLVALVNKCPELECINVGGMRVSPESFAGLLSISPALRIRSIPQILNTNVVQVA
ncbi:F-box protein At5g67140-like [Lolium rigidum]|uniref:F-box protein At5g67140-like n=1 Tax=Lolium rigidum TaxID=89674 RepID=UPI001F5C93A6|nr:F-box protein At5g67140-like [Lolium rigidum]